MKEYNEKELDAIEQICKKAEKNHDRTLSCIDENDVKLHGDDFWRFINKLKEDDFITYKSKIKKGICWVTVSSVIIECIKSI